MSFDDNWKIHLAHWLNGLGIDVFTFRRGLKGLPAVINEYRQFKHLSGLSNGFPTRFNYPCPADRYEEAGTASGHYFHQDLLVARKIFERNPARHMDVGSRIDGFVAHVAAFRAIEVLDLRQITKPVKNITFHQFDLMESNRQFEAGCDSLSCLHTLEHIGLGRYGDRLLVDGHIKGFERLGSLLKPGGVFYLSVPIGPQRIEFNAHRVFAVPTILALAREHYELLSFSFVDDRGDLHENVDTSAIDSETSFGCWYGCGIFEFLKKS
jgi:hypothetical protein